MNKSVNGCVIFMLLSFLCNAQDTIRLANAANNFIIFQFQKPNVEYTSSAYSVSVNEKKYYIYDNRRFFNADGVEDVTRYYFFINKNDTMVIKTKFFKGISIFVHNLKFQKGNYLIDINSNKICEGKSILREHDLLKNIRLTNTIDKTAVSIDLEKIQFHLIDDIILKKVDNEKEYYDDR